MTHLPYCGGRLIRLRPGDMSEDMFYILIDISSIRSEKVIYALRDYFVSFATRNEVCERYNVNPGYLSVKIKELQQLNNKLLRYYPYCNQFLNAGKINE